MPLDPTLLKAGMVDYSWIPNGVKDGITFAQAKMHLDQQKQLVEEQLAQRYQQREMIQYQKSMSVFEDLAKAMKEPPGKVRSVMIDALDQKAQNLGVNISPEVLTAANDKDYQPVFDNLIANVHSPDPQIRQQALTTAFQGGHMAIDNARQVSDMSTAVGKAQLEAKKAQDTVDFHNKSLAIKQQEFQSNQVKSLAKDAQAPEKQFGGILDNADTVKTLLAKKTATGDQAAMQLYTALMGKERITIAALNANTNIGSALDRANQIAGKYSKGTLLPDTIRKQMLNTVDTLKGAAADKMKAALDPVISRAKGNPLQASALQDGKIISKNRMAALYPDGSADSTTAPAIPVPPSQRSSGEQTAIQKSFKIGASLADINKQLALKKRPPMSPTEYSGWNKYFNPPAAPAPSQSMTTSAPDTSSDSDSDDTLSSVMGGSPDDPSVDTE